MHAATRELIRQRARQQCEYCRFPDHALELPFHVIPANVEHSIEIIEAAEEVQMFTPPREDFR